MTSGINIGHRHLLPIYPALFALAGGAAAWLSTRAGQVTVGVAFAWLLAANLYIHPHYLCYFNELTGGPARGHLYLADSNLDWGQDLLRLRDYAAAHPDEHILLSYFGSADPSHYVTASALPSAAQWGPHAALTAGTYVVSANNLLGVYTGFRWARPATWTPQLRDEYEAMLVAETQPSPAEDPQAVEHWQSFLRELHILKTLRLFSRLQQRPPDERIGYSLFVYRLTAEQVSELTAP
jgi:hypothetical protein